MTMLAKIDSGRISSYYNGDIGDVNYGTGAPNEQVIVPLPNWALELRRANEEAGRAQKILVWNYDTRTFTIATTEVDWQQARDQYISQIRNIRNKLLHYTDWVETTDRLNPEIKQEVMNYRDALRNFSHVNELSNSDNFKQWCESHAREPLPLEFLPEQSDVVKSFYIGHEIVL